jgi:hypothetical protein
VEREGHKVFFTIVEGRAQAVPAEVVGPVGDGSMLELKSGPTTGTVVVRHPSPELAAGLPVKEKR